MYQDIYYPVAALGAGSVKSPGLCSIKIFRREDVLTWPAIDPETGVLASGITLKAGKFIYLLGSIDASRRFTENQKSSNAGYHFETTVKAQLMGSSAAHHLTLGTLIHHEWGILVKDKNGVTRLIGNQDSAADLITDYDSGQGTESRKTDLTFKWQHPQPAAVYTAAAFDIVIGGEIITAGCIQLLASFEVGAAGSPMNDGDTIYINSAMTNKRVFITIDGMAPPIDDGSGDIDWTGSIDRRIEKAVASNTAVFVGGVKNEEKIYVYAIT